MEEACCLRLRQELKVTQRSFRVVEGRRGTNKLMQINASNLIRSANTNILK